MPIFKICQVYYAFINYQDRRNKNTILIDTMSNRIELIWLNPHKLLYNLKHWVCVIWRNSFNNLLHLMIDLTLQRMKSYSSIIRNEKTNRLFKGDSFLTFLVIESALLNSYARNKKYLQSIIVKCFNDTSDRVLLNDISSDIFPFPLIMYHRTENGISNTLTSLMFKPFW